MVMPYCQHNSDGGASRQPAINKERGPITDFARVKFLSTDLSLPDLGLGAACYGHLVARQLQFGFGLLRAVCGWSAATGRLLCCCS
ncbi:hypothetical protein BX600DRAFT_468647 [Xylariales sp. PMI_506]|nr:hypothetical protein BX600DRAFT_468647 [Xylariales sp. PMI_506]